MDFNHFLITRFNLRLPRNMNLKDRSGNDVRGKEWLDHRTNLFIKYCLPSVLNQTNKKFSWLIYFDSATSNEVLSVFRDIETQYKNLIRIILADDYDSFLKSYCNDVLDMSDRDCKYIITTRLDNDDIIHKDFVSAIQNKFRKQNFIAVNFLKILMLNPEKTNKLHIDYIFSNHFISVIEARRSSGIAGCYSRGDRYWNIRNEIIQITDRPYCIEIISGRNLLNRFRGFPVFKKTDLSGFSLENMEIKNTFWDCDNLKLWRMSWKKLTLYHWYKLNGRFNYE